MNLNQIYEPIAGDLKVVEDVLVSVIKESKNQSILSMADTLLESPGKKIRPALVLLSEKAASAGEDENCNRDEIIKLAAAVELVHRASLIHDDVLDNATMRHGSPSINIRLGDDVSIIFGDYIYSKAFDLIAKCKNPDVFECICQAVNLMSEGELIQVCQRGNFDLTKESYMAIIEKKTASLFAASCHVGTIAGRHSRSTQMLLKDFGLNFGIAFQIIDDCEDIISEEKVLGKFPGQDAAVGDMTLPLLNLLDVADRSRNKEVNDILNSEIDRINIKRLREMFVDSGALDLTHQTAMYYITQAKSRLDELQNSDYKMSLNYLADYITQKA